MKSIAMTTGVPIKSGWGAQSEATPRHLVLNVESRGVWRSSVQKLPDLRDCRDVDLAVTPATNTLPIRRLNLEVGSSESVIAAWVKFPELTIQPLSQRYTRLAKNAYRY